MKWMNGMIRQLCLYPYDEVYKVLCALEEAADKKDLESLIWCARRLNWFHERGETSWSDLSQEQQEDLFEQAYRGNPDPPPALIAGLVAPDKEKPEHPAAKDAGEALDTVRRFFEENLAKKKLPEALKSLEALRGAAAALAGEQRPEKGLRAPLYFVPSGEAGRPHAGTRRERPRLDVPASPFILPGPYDRPGYFKETTYGSIRHQRPPERSGVQMYRPGGSVVRAAGMRPL